MTSIYISQDHFDKAFPNVPISQPVPLAINAAPGYCKNCKDYTIEEPLFAQPVPLAERQPMTHEEAKAFVAAFVNKHGSSDLLKLIFETEKHHKIGEPK